jgi:carbon monoxide dehydrogenase subunit G
VNLEYSGREIVPASKERVWAFINDPASVGSCLPDVVEMKVQDDRHVDATVGVAVGPVRGKFRFKIELVPDSTGSQMGMKINGGGFGSVVDLTATAALSGQGGETMLDWKGNATMRGPVATVGGRVLDAQAKRVITQTFANVRSKLATGNGA